MKTYLRTGVATLCLFFFLLTKTNAQTFNANLAAMLQDSLSGMVASFTNTQGISASVYIPGQGLWEGTAGYSYPGQPLTSDMVFGLASNSKLYTAVMMLKLQENGIFDLDDPISNWLAPIPNVNPTITIRQLLNHKSGVSDPFFSTALLDTINAHPTQVYTPAMVFAWLGAPTCAPGTCYQYSNINYILAGMIAESATGISIAQLIRDSILNPLGLDSTFYDIEEPITGNLAHRWVAGADLHDTSRVSLNTAGGAAGSMFATAGEVAQWYHALMTGQVIDQNSYNEMITFAAPGNYGLGIQSQSIFGHTYWGHSGGTFGYRTKVMHDECMGTTVVGIANNSEAAEQGITALLFRIIWDNVPSCPGIITGTNSVCPGETGFTYSVPPILHATSYIWTLPNGVVGSSNTNSITVDFSMSAVSGNITVCGNSNFGTGPTVSFPVIVNTVPTGITVSGDSLIVADSTADSYQWIDCSNSLPIGGAINQIFEPTLIGNYAVILTRGSCVDTSACSVINFSGTGSYDTEHISIYPNPSNGIVRINVGDLIIEKLEVVNNLGQIMYQSLSNLTELNLTTQPKGAYFIKIYSNNKVYTRKIIIQ